MTRSKRSRATKEGVAPRPKAAGDVAKPRIPIIQVDFGRPVILSGLSAPDGSGQVTFFDEAGTAIEPGYVASGVVYERPTKPKFVTLGRQDPGLILVDPNAYLARFEHIIAVDTNTVQHNGEMVSVAAVNVVTNISIEADSWSANLVRQSLLEARGVTSKPERLGWRHALWLFDNSGLSGNVALVIDSELDQHRAINDRTQPLLGSYYLPSDVTLVFASADADHRRWIANAALHECDRDATALIQRLIAPDSASAAVMLRDDMPQFCDTYRLWPPEVLATSRLDRR